MCFLVVIVRILIMSDIWKDAPEGATHISDEGCFYKIDKRGSNDYCFCSNEKWVTCALSTDFVGALKFRSEDKPIYTAAMCEAEFNKEFCVRGGADDIWVKCKIVFVGKRYTVVENENGKEFSRKSSNIRLRDVKPPIELVDGKAYQFTYDSDECTGIAMKGLFLIPHVSGSMFHASPTDCTNITLLNPEVKS